MSQDLGPKGPPEIDEEQLHEAAPRVRALQVQRYEQMWQIVEREMQGALQDVAPMDPRLLEIGIRILKEEAAIYRLGKAPMAVEDDEDPAHAIDPRETVLQQLAELEAKVKKSE